MPRRWPLNLALMLGVAVLAAALWAARPKPAPKPAPVAASAVAAVHRIAVRTGDGALVFARDGADAPWRMVAPVNARADGKRLAALLQLAGTRPNERYARGAIGAQTTGLAAPALVVRYNDGPPVAVGGPGPTPGSRYVRAARALLLVAAPQLRLDGPGWQRLGWPHWLARGLVAPGARLVGLTLPKITLSRGRSGTWRVTPARADRGADYARATASAWRHARALAVTRTHARRPRRARVTLRFAGALPRRLDVVARAPRLVLRDPALGVAYHLAANEAGPLLDMAHPAALGAARPAPASASAIPLAPYQTAP